MKQGTTPRSLVRTTSELFRYHGVWGAGVRLFRNMTFAGKAGVISTVFLLVIALLAYDVLRASNDVLRTAERELAGVDDVRAVVVLMGVAQEYRRAVLAAGGKAGAEVTDRLGRLDGQLKKVEALLAGDAEAAAAAKFVRDALTPLATPADDAEAAFTRADEFVQQVMRLNASVVDASGLSLDPDADSCHLMMASTTETLQAIRMLGRMRDLGVDASSPAAACAR